MTNRRFTLVWRNWGKGQFFSALSDLTQGCDFETKEKSTVRDMFIYNMRNKEIKKQLYIDTLSPADTLQFAVVSRWEGKCIKESVMAPQKLY